MPTLLVRGVPDTLYQQLKRMASLHHRSLTQEAISVLESGLRAATPPPRPAPETVEDWLRREVWTLPVLDDRSPDEILGYNDDGLFD
jgi:plasmid stability protein